MVEAKQQIVSERVVPVQLKPFLIKGKMTLPSGEEKPVVSATSSICATQRTIEQEGRGYIQLC
jgi:hypothetical protein